MKQGGQCILNTFRPYADPTQLRATWAPDEEALDWEVPVEGGRVACFVQRGRLTPDPLVLHPQLTYRRYRGAELTEEVRSSISMRCWYPEELLARIQGEGVVVTATWGGYAGEPYGTGSELVAAFTAA